MQGIYNYIPETKHFSSVYIVAAILWLQFMVHVMLLSKLNLLYFHNSTIQSVCAMPKMTFL